MKRQSHINTSEREVTIRGTHVGKSKIIILQLPVGGWEKFDALHIAAQAKMPGILHDNIVSGVFTDWLSKQPEPGSMVDEPKQIG